MFFRFSLVFSSLVIYILCLPREARNEFAYIVSFPYVSQFVSELLRSTCTARSFLLFFFLVINYEQTIVIAHTQSVTVCFGYRPIFFPSLFVFFMSLILMLPFSCVIVDGEKTNDYSSPNSGFCGVVVWSKNLSNCRCEFIKIWMLPTSGRARYNSTQLIIYRTMMTFIRFRSINCDWDEVWSSTEHPFRSMIPFFSIPLNVFSLGFSFGKAQLYFVWGRFFLLFHTNIIDEMFGT